MVRGFVKSKWGLVLGVVVVAAVVVTAALAYYTSTGSGTGSASTATAQDVVLTAATPTSKLYPGGSAAIALTVANPNAFPVRIGRLSLDTGQGTAGFATAAAGCDVSTLSFTATLATQNNAGAGWDVPASAAAFPVTLTDAVAMSAAAANECQGATFSVYLQATPS